MSTTLLACILSVFVLNQPAPKESGSDPYTLNEIIDVAAKRYEQSEPTAAVAEALQLQLDAGNFNPVSKDGIRMKVTAEWIYTDDPGPREVCELRLEYRAGAFHGLIVVTRDNLPAGSTARIAPKHLDLANLAVQRLVGLWSDRKEWRKRLSDGLKGAPKP
jgi:hypothetical protein